MLKYLMEHTANLAPDTRTLEHLQPPYPAPQEPGSSPLEWVASGNGNQPSQSVVTGGWSRQEVVNEPDPGSAGESPPAGSLSRLLHDKEMSNDSMVDCALDWLLDRDFDFGSREMSEALPS
jgi:hypothetical protein